jgi:hypothetical protein
LRRYRKKHPHETVATLANLRKYQDALNLGAEPASIQAGFIHREPMGVVALDQRGATGGTRERRLYVYALKRDRSLHLITIGDRNTQQQDIATCRDYVKSLRKES